MSRWDTGAGADERDDWSDDAEDADAQDDPFDEGEWELDPNDPTHPDHDLSEASGYAEWDPAPKPLLLRRGTMLLLVLLVIFGLMIPILARLGG